MNGCARPFDYGAGEPSGKPTRPRVPTLAGPEIQKPVLIVDGDPLGRTLLRDILFAHGIDTVETGNAARVIGLIRRHRPCLIFVDVDLAKHNGIRLACRLKRSKDLGAIPLIGVTALPAEDGRDLCLRAGCDGHLARPVSIDRVLEAVAGFLP